MGIPCVGAVKKLVTAQAELCRAEWQKSSLPCLTQDSRWVHPLD